MAYEANIFGYSRQFIARQFSDSVKGLSEGLFLVVCDRCTSAATHDALEKTALFLGYDANHIAVVFVDGDKGSLSPSELFRIIEGIDPLCVVLASRSAAELFLKAYHIESESETSFRAFCRDVRSLPTLDSLLQSPDGKQRAWSILKTLPKK